MTPRRSHMRPWQSAWCLPPLLLPRSSGPGCSPEAADDAAEPARPALLPGRPIGLVLPWSSIYCAWAGFPAHVSGRWFASGDPWSPLLHVADPGPRRRHPGRPAGWLCCALPALSRHREAGFHRFFARLCSSSPAPSSSSLAGNGGAGWSAVGTARHLVPPPHRLRRLAPPALRHRQTPSSPSLPAASATPG